MSFSSLAQPAIEPLVERFGGADDLTLLVGAGASMEAGLPSWKNLVERLLDTVADARPELDTPKLRERWKRLTIERDDLLGASAVVEVLAAEELEELLPRQLYGEAGPAGYQPGPIAHQVARLRLACGERTEVLTTNYDDLIEQALIGAGIAPTRVRSYRTSPRRYRRAAGTVGVTHLHGIAGRRDPAKSIVLSEEDYHRMQRGSSWQERLVTERLQNSSCLFVGMSLADPNLIRYLYGYEAPPEPRHAAIFVRQGEPASPGPVRAVLEEAAAERWKRCGVQAVFVDHYADAAQLLYEICHRREQGSAYVPIGERARALIELCERGLAANGDRSAFAQRQVAFSAGLRTMLDTLITRLVEAGVTERSPGEILGAALWLFTPDGTGLVGWAHSDRAHQDPTTVVPVPVLAESNWVAVRAVCRGVRVELNRDNYASRWRFVRAFPLVLEEPSRIPIGCLTVSSSKPANESVLAKMPAEIRGALHQAFDRAGLGLVEVLISIGEDKFEELSK